MEPTSSKTDACYKPGDTYEEAFSFAQEDVNQFAELTGDKNPIHVDPEYAANTFFKRPIVHGFLAGTAFSKVFGMSFPGEGTIYLKQSMEFRRPIYPSSEYKVVMEVKETPGKNRGIIDTKIVEVESGKPVIVGEALITHKKYFPE